MFARGVAANAEGTRDLFVGRAATKDFEDFKLPSRQIPFRD